MEDQVPAARRGRAAGGRFVVGALVVYVLCALWATWPAVRHLDGEHYLARPAPGFGEAAAGDHLQLGWAFWLVGHQLEHGRSPLADPYSFRPDADAPPNLQGWLLGVPFWPLSVAFGSVWAYDLVVLLSFLLAGGLTCWWLRSLGLSPPAALVGGAVFALMPYRVGQSTGHLLGLIAFLLPALLLALERRRLVLVAVLLAAIPLSGQLHLALGAIPLVLGYAWARLPRPLWGRALAGAGAALVAGLVVERWAIAGSIGTGRSYAQVGRYSAELSDLVTRGVGSGVEELVFVGWFVPVLAVAGLWSLRRQRGTAALLALAAVVPGALALGENLPGYRALWDAVPGLRSTRVPERLFPIACLALAALAAAGLDALLRRVERRRAGSASPSAAQQRKGPAGASAERGARGRQATACCLPASPLVVALTAVTVAAVALDLRVPTFGAVAADTPSPAYAEITGERGMLELPVLRPDIHYGSVYLGYARQSPRRRPQGYSTLAPPGADRWARRHRGLSCGRGTVPAEIGWVVVHRGVYRQSEFFGPGCPARAEAMLSRSGWRIVARDAPLTTWAAP